jgi:hypothetical protein
MNEFLTHSVMLELLIVAYVQYVIMLIDLQKVLSQDLKCIQTYMMRDSYMTELFDSPMGPNTM